ncbi:MAG: LCP family protein [Coriobacteriia bacterium]|nr:LCP family protein [Coriobacteriia bacterium]
MTESPKRSKQTPESRIPEGYRSSRRASRSLKQAKRAERADRVANWWHRLFDVARRLGYVLAVGVTALVGVALVLLLVVTAVNGIARWSGLRSSGSGKNPADATSNKPDENLLIIGDDGGKAAGFLAMRIDPTAKQILGIAIPEGAFIEVPGQGFERIGESYPAGAEVSLTAISNYLTVPFKRYVVVPGSAYRAIVKNRQVADLASQITSTSLTPEERVDLTAAIAEVPAKSIAFVPLPVKPIKLGTQTYYEPQRQEVADLLQAWWGVDPAATSDVTRVIVYNGAGSPGVAGDAAQMLIRGGFRVVDTKNADNFKYKTTTVVVQRGPIEKGQQVVEVLGAGVVKERRTDENISDIIVVIGKDFSPTKK